MVGETVALSTTASVAGSVTVKVIVGRGVSLTCGTTGGSDSVSAAGEKMASGVVVFTGRAAGVGGAAGVQAARNNMANIAILTRLNKPGRPTAPPGESFILLAFLAAPSALLARCYRVQISCRQVRQPANAVLCRAARQ